MTKRAENKGLAEAPQVFVHDSPAPSDGRAARHKVKVGPGGRIVIPAALREVMGIGEGDTLVLAQDEGGMRIMTMDDALARARKLMRAVIPADAKLVDELIADRRAEAARE